MWWKTVLDLILKPITKPIEARRRKRYAAHLKYALERLERPTHYDLDPTDRKYKIEIVHWLLNYYCTTPYPEYILYCNDTPEAKLKKLLSKSTRDIILRDYVFIKVLYGWKENRRIEGF
jgi:hypothetical protein